jgi:hypothetical protein
MTLSIYDTRHNDTRGRMSFTLSVVRLNVVRLNVVRLSVVAPFLLLKTLYVYLPCLLGQHTKNYRSVC